MKAVINLLRYDTDTAVRIRTAKQATPAGVAPAWTVALYRTPKGAYFLHQRGILGAAEAGDDPLSGEQAITPLTVAQAYEWAAANMGAAAVAAEFGALIQDA